jgi:hypothetical protein
MLKDRKGLLKNKKVMLKDRKELLKDRKGMLTEKRRTLNGMLKEMIERQRNKLGVRGQNLRVCVCLDWAKVG